MTLHTTSAPSRQPTALQPTALHAHFLASVLPAVERHACIYFRHVRCRHRREDAVAEAVALAWKWFVRLAHRGKDAARFPTTLATFAARAVRCGRRVVGQEKAKDVLSPVAQQRRGFAVGKLPDFSTLSDNPLAEALTDNTVSPVPEQVAFRLDFPAWLGTLGGRNRQIAEDMALGHRTQELARKYGVSQSRVSQMRAAFHEGWLRFTGEDESVAAA